MVGCTGGGMGKNSGPRILFAKVCTLNWAIGFGKRWGEGRYRECVSSFSL